MKYTTIAVVFALCGLVASAQEFEDDARLWLYLKLNKKIAGKLSGQLTLQNRFDDNVTRFDQIALNPEVNYKINNAFRLTGGISYGRQHRLDGAFNNQYQAYLGVLIRQSSGPWKVTLRSLTQAQWQNIYTSENGNNAFVVVRNKLSLVYSINKRFEAFTYGEINTPPYRFSERPISRRRVCVGLSTQLNKRSAVDTWFMHQVRYNFGSLPRRDFIYGLTYSYNL